MKEVRGIIGEQLIDQSVMRKTLIDSGIYLPEQVLGLDIVNIDKAYYIPDKGSGFDALLTYTNRGQEFRETTDWKKTHELPPPFTLRGLYTTTDMARDGQYGSEHLSIFTSPERFNEIMAQLGRTPGEDCFKLVRKSCGERPFTPIEYLRPLANEGAIPIADDNSYIKHDRLGDDHIPAWWSTPPEIFKAIKQRARELKKMGRRDKRDVMTVQLDHFSLFPSSLVKFTHPFIDGQWQPGETIEERVNEFHRDLDFYYHRTGSEMTKYPNMTMSYSVNDITTIFGKLGVVKMPSFRDRLLRRGEREQAEEIARQITTAYVQNIVDIHRRLDDIQGPPFQDAEGLEKREAFIHALMNPPEKDSRSTLQ